MPSELVPIRNDRDHRASSYADTRAEGPSTVRRGSRTCTSKSLASAGRPRMGRVSRLALTLLACVTLGALAVPAAAADLSDEQALAQRHAPIVRLVEQTEPCGHGEPFVPTDIDALLGNDTVALRGPWNRTDLVKIGPVAKDLVGPLRVPPRLPRRSARPRVRLRAVGETDHRGQQADRLRARRDRGGPPREGLAPVLVLLPLQRLQQHARGRLGDDPARLRRRECEGRARQGSRRGRVQRSRGGSALELGGRQAPGRRRDAPRRLPGCGIAREQVRRGALARQLGRGRSRVRRHARAAHAARAAGRDDPERPGGREGRVPLDRVRGPLGRAREGVLQRAHRPQPEDAVDEADRVVRGLERPQLRRADRRALRYEHDRLLLLGGRARVARAHPTPAESAPDADLRRGARRARDLRGGAGDMDARRAAPDRPPPLVGPDHLRLRTDVREAARALHRARRAA